MVSQRSFSQIWYANISLVFFYTYYMLLSVVYTVCTSLGLSMYTVCTTVHLYVICLYVFNYYTVGVFLFNFKNSHLV